MATLDLALSLLKNGQEDSLLPDRINQLARDSGHEFRNTQLTPGQTLRLFAQQIAAGNIACSAVHHLAGHDTGTELVFTDMIRGRSLMPRS